MNGFKRISLLCLTTLLLFAFGCSSSASKESTGELVDDSAITAKVKSEILQAPTLKMTEINVETFKGVVQLSGFVGSQAEIATAAEVAGKVKGVTEVRNDLLIKEKTTSKNEGAAEYVDSTAITAQVKAAFLKDPSLKSAEINVETFKNVVQLSGFVGSQAEVVNAAALAGSIAGVKSVRNDIRIKGKQ